jgi:hypothetical protein
MPILLDKSSYMQMYATYVNAWEHTALAYQASASGDGVTFTNEASQAMRLFSIVEGSPTFGADARRNHDILAGLLA